MLLFKGRFAAHANKAHCLHMTSEQDHKTHVYVLGYPRLLQSTASFMRLSSSERDRNSDTRDACSICTF